MLRKFVLPGSLNSVFKTLTLVPDQIWSVLHKVIEGYDNFSYDYHLYLVIYM